MRFQINAEEFEESEETKTGAMRYKVMEAVQRTNYLENVYEQKAGDMEQFLLCGRFCYSVV